eukprot:706022-Ditylum_brightwellii.AAC.1
MEPEGISRNFVKGQPLDVAVDGDASIIEVDVTITPNPAIKPTGKKQLLESTKTSAADNLKIKRFSPL